ncbi:restriction endonuclease subunit S [Lacticaseibacillus rhamnosus]|uniref:restriction endonuclease subunit S n=1 Tax=Lacticaseibacillus rhamnosus TaxID=47715 RepID=UPI00237F3B7F|nr:restriction endonuclease subunit S [Lacticaseibacillus rhamnosus]MDE3292844.1 restriction endonuclease subunit S [Lacticaseibacillus rhamnosus]
MSANQTKYPQLRFKGFTDPWEKRTLGQTTTKAKSYSLSRDVERDHETGYRYIHYGDIHTGVADIVTEHTKLPNIEPANYDELRVNDLVVADASEDYQGIAEPAVVVGLPTQHLVAGLHTITLRPSSASSLYLYYLLHTDSFKHFGYQMGTGLKVFGISWSNLSKFTFMIPSRPEQEMIVKLIESVDNLIAVNQRKLAKLKELKQVYLQKMFPKNGSKFPQLRFSGFADAWEERKFLNLAEVRRGLTYKPSDVQKYGIRVLRSSNIAEDTFLIKSDDVFVNKEAVKIDNVKNGDILITSANGSSRLVGKHALIEGIENDTVHGGFMLVARAEKPEFVNAIMSSSWYSKFINIFVSGGNGAIGNLSKSDLEDQKVYVPSEIEQTKIGLFFKGLDDTIALHQRKLEKLQELKKGYLQKMFC